jgi:ABC-type oligopeptide transport system substrate-binding subunit
MKRIGIIALSTGLVLALGACSSSSSDSGSSTSSTSAPPTSTAPAATSAAADTGDLSGTWSGQYDGTFQGTFVLDWQQSGSNLRRHDRAVLWIREPRHQRGP